MAELRAEHMQHHAELTQRYTDDLAARTANHADAMEEAMQRHVVEVEAVCVSARTRSQWALRVFLFVFGRRVTQTGTVWCAVPHFAVHTSPCHMSCAGAPAACRGLGGCSAPPDE